MALIRGERVFAAALWEEGAAGNPVGAGSPCFVLGQWLCAEPEQGAKAG